MSLCNRHVVSINDLSNSEIIRILDVAAEFDEQLSKDKVTQILTGKRMTRLFFEPSTRTYLSFGFAWKALGGIEDGMPDAGHQSSAAKGESIADTIRTAELYSHLVVMRHPLDGSARVASDFISKPFINAGDGAHEHPSQTLLDLYAIRKEKGNIKGQTVAIFGDLLHSRTVHSLAYGLVRLGAELHCVAPPGLGLPTHVGESLRAIGWKGKQYETLDEVIGKNGVWYQAEHLEKGGGKQQMAVSIIEMVLKQFDAMYFTRLQSERASDEGSAHDIFAVNEQLLDQAGAETIIMHPLPRRNELAYAVDADKRAAYFRQAGYGLPVRMALLALLMGAVSNGNAHPPHPRTCELNSTVTEVDCANDRCVSRHEPYVQSKYWLVPNNPRLLRCYYCDYEMINPTPPEIGVSQFGEIVPSN